METHMNRRRRLHVAIAASAAAALTLTACTGKPGDNGTDPDSNEQAASIVFWTPQVTPDRLDAQEQIAAAFEDETGIAVEVVPLGAADQNQALVTGAASGDVPDVILHAPDQTAAWRDQGLLDTELAQSIVDELGVDTFNERALEFVSLAGEIGAVPSDGWVHLITYRADLFEAAGVDVPTNLDELADAAAASVHSSESIVTSPSSTSWQPAARKIDSTASVDDGVPGWVPSAMPETPVSASAAAASASSSRFVGTSTPAASKRSAR